MAELEALLSYSHLWPTKPTHFISTLEKLSDENREGKKFAIGECNRQTPFACLKVFLKAFAVVWRERPEVILTTGSLPLALFCLAGRLVGAQIIWIDSISQVDELSMSGRLVKPFASLFFVQWPELAEKHTGTVYAGELV
ncbi:MAG: hypothetical protein RIC89_07440 [Pseudomonadales bacterium]